jgi:hypothetical protein
VQNSLQQEEIRYGSSIRLLLIRSLWHVFEGISTSCKVIEQHECSLPNYDFSFFFTFSSVQMGSADANFLSPRKAGNPVLGVLKSVLWNRAICNSAARSSLKANGHAPHLDTRFTPATARFGGKWPQSQFMEDLSSNSAYSPHYFHLHSILQSSNINRRLILRPKASLAFVNASNLPLEKSV